MGIEQNETTVNSQSLIATKAHTCRLAKIESSKSDRISLRNLATRKHNNFAQCLGYGQIARMFAQNNADDISRAKCGAQEFSNRCSEDFRGTQTGRVRSSLADWRILENFRSTVSPCHYNCASTSLSGNFQSSASAFSPRMQSLDYESSSMNEILENNLSTIICIRSFHDKSDFACVVSNEIQAPATPTCP